MRFLAEDPAPQDRRLDWTPKSASQHITVSCHHLRLFYILVCSSDLLCIALRPHDEAPITQSPPLPNLRLATASVGGACHKDHLHYLPIHILLRQFHNARQIPPPRPRLRTPPRPPPQHGDLPNRARIHNHDLAKSQRSPKMGRTTHHAWQEEHECLAYKSRRDGISTRKKFTEGLWRVKRKVCD